MATKKTTKATTKKTDKVDVKLSCSCCGKTKKETEFYMSKAYINKATNRLTLCKDCMGDVYDSYFEKYNDVKLSLYYTCRALCICFNLSCFYAAINEMSSGERDTPAWKVYMTKLNSLGSKNGAGDDFDSSDYLDVAEELKATQEDELVLRWGVLPDADIRFLEENYYQWTTRHQCESRAEEILFEQICHMQLDIQKTRENGGDVVKKVEALQKLMTSANIRPLDQSAMNINENLMMWGTTVAAVEKNEPCEFFDEYKRKEYKDFMGYRSYFYKWVLRPLKNLLTGSKDFNINDNYLEGDIDGRN